MSAYIFVDFSTWQLRWRCRWRGTTVPFGGAVARWCGVHLKYGRWCHK